MSLIASEKGGKDFDPIPAGMHQAVCYGIYDLGTQPSNNPAFSDAHKVLLTFELPHERGDFEKDGIMSNQPRVSSKEYTLSIGDKANLKRDLVSWRGREFTKEEKANFDISVLAGVNCQINLVHKVSGKGTTYANITSISPLSKGMTKVEPENPICIYTMPDEGNIVIPETVPEWIAKKIMASIEYQEFMNPTASKASAPVAPAPTAPAAEEDDEDSMPFWSVLTHNPNP